MPTEPTQAQTPTSEDEQRRDTCGVVHVGAGLPPMAPAKSAAKVSLEGIAAAKGAESQEKAMDDARKPANKQTEKASAKGKTKTGKKVAAKSERVDRRRKRKTKAGRAGISQESAELLFRCTCQALRTQALDYGVRALEMEERNSTQAKEIDKWEKRIRSLKRELHEYADEQPGEAMSLALMEAKPPAKVVEEQQKASATAAVTSVSAAAQSAFGAESSLPPAVVAAEDKLHGELHKRTQMMDEFCRNVPGFIDSLDDRR